MRKIIKYKNPILQYSKYIWFLYYTLNILLYYCYLLTKNFDFFI
jgi:hypothetical protein